MIFSYIFPRQLVIEIGLQFVGSCSSPFPLKMADMFAIFH